jgi:antitoxin MazE
MQANIISIGNSKGIRLSKTILKQYNIDDVVELELREDCVVLYPVKKNPREGWEEAFAEMHANGDDKLVWGDDIWEEDIWD